MRFNQFRQEQLAGRWEYGKMRHDYGFSTRGIIPKAEFQPVLDWCLEHFGHSVAFLTSRWVHGYYNSIHARFIYHNCDVAMEGERIRIILFNQQDDAFHFRMRWC